MRENRGTRSGLYVFYAALIALVFIGCSSSDTSVSDTSVFETSVFDTNIDMGLTESNNNINLVIRNQSGRTAYIKFIGKTVHISPNDNESIETGHSKVFSIESIESGRIYISYDKALSSNAPDGANPTDKDYRTRFDKVELTYNVNGNHEGNANLTAVDFYSIPMIFETSIEGTTIEHLTLGESQTGKKVEAAIKAILSNASAAVIDDGTDKKETVRILSPVKKPGAYEGFNEYLSTLMNNAILTISGTFYGTPYQSYNFTGSISADSITLTEGGHKISIPMTSLQDDNADLINHNGIYTCNGYFTVDGSNWAVDKNDIYAAVYRDLVTGFNLGFVKPGANNSAEWWTSPPFQEASCNKYAKVIADTYPGAYGFPFNDRYEHILADLGGKIDTMTITLLDDNATPSPYNPSGTRNPQSGVVTFNMPIITSDVNFNKVNFSFDNHNYTGGNGYDFPDKPVPFDKTNTMTAQINKIPAQKGLNIYDLALYGKKCTVFIMVGDDGEIQWGNISGGGNATWVAPNLFIGGFP